MPRMPLLALCVAWAVLGSSAFAGQFDLWGKAAEQKLTELSAAYAASQPADDVRKEVGILHHMIAVEDTPGHAGPAVAALEPYVTAHPNDFTALAFLGSARTLMGRDASNPIQKVDHVRAGLKELDRAIEAAPDDISIRVVRAYNSASLPSMFERLPTFDADIEYLLAHGDVVAHADPTLRATALLLIGDYHKNHGDYANALESWNGVRAVAGEGAKVAQDAEKRLALFQF